jgi:hypothetical protein
LIWEGFLGNMLDKSILALGMSDLIVDAKARISLVTSLEILGSVFLCGWKDMSLCPTCTTTQSGLRCRMVANLSL